MRHPHLFTSESVTEGHPDKVADQISDAVLDALLADDPRSRVACETMVTTGLATIFGEITTTSYVHLPKLVRDTIAKIGYTESGYGFDAESCAVMSTIDKQSAHIAMGGTRRSRQRRGHGHLGHRADGLVDGGIRHATETEVDDSRSARMAGDHPVDARNH